MRRVLLLVLLTTVFIISPFAITTNAKDDVSPIEPEQVIFETIDRDSGLSNLSVSSIVQDKYGFIWFGTQGGLNRYDSNEFVVYKDNPFTNEGLVHNLIQTMTYDYDNHDLWIGTYQGISHFDIDTSTFTNYNVQDNGLSNQIIVAIEIDEDGYVWIGTMNGLNRLNPSTGDITKYEVPGEVVRDLQIDSLGRLLIGTYEGLHYFNENTMAVTEIPLTLPSPYVMVIKEFNEGIISLGLWGGGVVQYDLFTLEIFDEHLPTENVYSLDKSSDGDLWIGTWGNGLFLHNDVLGYHHFEVGELHNSIAHPIVYSILEDTSGIMWFGTNGGGVSRLNIAKKNFVMFSSDEDEENNINFGKINSIFRDSNEDLWISIYNNGMNRYDSSEGIMYSYFNDETDETSLFDDHVLQMLQYDENRLLLGSSTGLGWYDLNTQEFSRWDLLSQDKLIYSLFKDENILWIGTYLNGVYRYDILGETLTHYSTDEAQNAISDNLINTIFVDSKDRVWFGTNYGLNRLNQETNEITQYFLQNQNGLGSNIIRNITETPNGDIWIATNGGGVSKFNEDDTFTTYTENDGLSSNIVMSVIVDDSNHLWASTQNGISKIDLDTLDIIALSPQEGIGGWDFNTGHLLDTDGSVLFGGIHGVVKIPTHSTPIETIASNVYITSFSLANRSIPSGIGFYNNTSHTFETDENSIDITFVALNYDTTLTDTFYFRLTGFEKEFIKANNTNSVHYSNLPSGSYTFEVYSVNSNGDVSDIATVSFSIKVPFSQTGFAYTLYVVLFVLGIYILMKIREGFILSKKNEELEKLNTKLHDLSIKDSLTGIYNRRYFDIEVENVLALSIRSELEISLMVIDIDNFKDINDMFGHLNGDIILKDIAERINRNLLRTSDFVCRYGGDEFAILLCNTTQSGSMLVAEKIQKAISGQSYTGGIDVTVSIGVHTTIPARDMTVDKLIEKADKALYTAKDKGKDQIYIIK